MTEPAEKKYVEKQVITDALCSAADGDAATISAFMDLVDKLPAASVADVVNGVWVQKYEWHDGIDASSEHGYLECSRCGFKVYDYEPDYFDYEAEYQENMPHYCEDCGAKMESGAVLKEAGADAAADVLMPAT